MTKNLDCLSRIKALRFKNDSLADAGLRLDEVRLKEYQEKLKCDNLASSTRIVPQIFPGVGKAIEDVRQRLIPDFTIDAYVRNSADIQACCFPGTGKSVSIALTSGLIQLYSVDELRFVIGHELGHHLFGHHAYPNPDDAGSQVEKLNILALRRAGEISADRIGFVAVSKKDNAYKAVLKLASGLPDEYIRFDLSAYLEQARDLKNRGGSEYGLLSSHPACSTRMRALLWFDLSEPYHNWMQHPGKAPISSAQLDARVAKDMSAASGFRLSEINKEEVDSALRWGVLSLFVSDGHLSKEEQVLMRKTFGEESATDVLEFIRDNGPAGVNQKFDASLRSIRLMNEETKEGLYRDLEHFAELAGGELDVRKKVLEMTLSRISLKREINLS